MKKITLLFTIFIAFFSVSQESITFYPSKDLSLGYHDNFGSEDNNYGWAFQFAGYVMDGAAGGINSNRAMLGFDLDSILPGTEILSAKLSFYAFDDYSQGVPMAQGHYGNNECYLKRIIQNWEEDVATWNTQPSTTDVGQIILPQSTSAHEDYLDIDVTALIQFFIDNPSQNFGFKFGLIEEILGNNLSFHSRESTDLSKRPKLVVELRPATAKVMSEELAKFEIYPNPVSDFLNLKLNEEIINNAILNVFDMKGKNVLSINNYKGEKLKLDISKLERGSYFLEIKNGKYYQKVKFIKN
ncbi:MAG: DNRLRE domain-containing protein [Bacteroidota bacterium]